MSKELYRYEGYELISLFKYPVIKETPCGYWINDYIKERWVSKNSNSSWAKDSIEKAKESYIARKKKQIQYLKGQLIMANHGLKNAQNNSWEEYISLEKILLFDDAIDKLFK